METIYTYDPGKKKEVKCGDLDGDTFLRTVKTSHFMRVSNSYGIQEEVIQLLKEKGCVNIVLLNYTGDTLLSKLSDWLAPDIKICDYDYGPQRFMPVDRMKKG